MADRQVLQVAAAAFALRLDSLQRDFDLYDVQGGETAQGNAALLAHHLHALRHRERDAIMQIYQVCFVAV